jgi:hypothetical protein
MALKDEPDKLALLQTPGVTLAAQVLASEHWQEHWPKGSTHNVLNILHQYEHVLAAIDARIVSEPHRLHYEVLLRHHKRVLMVYRAIADDHDCKTKKIFDKKPSKTQVAIRQRGRDSDDGDNGNDDAEMAVAANLGDMLTSSDTTNTPADTNLIVPAGKV